MAKKQTLRERIAELEGSIERSKHHNHQLRLELATAEGRAAQAEKDQAKAESKLASESQFEWQRDRRVENLADELDEERIKIALLEKEIEVLRSVMK